MTGRHAAKEDTMTTASSLGLSATQLRNAEGIIAAAKARKWSSRAAIIAVETALTESGMRILASANVPASVKYPHDLLSWTSDGLGHDHASCGMFQQQTGWAWALPGTTTMGSANGWGTPAELMDPQRSTAKFFDALARVDWTHLTRWAAAQAVQCSAFSDGSNYRQQDARAVQIVTALWGSAVPAVPPTTGTPKPIVGTTVYTVVKGDSLGAIAARRKTTVLHLQLLNHLANPNLIRIGQKLRVPALSAAPPAPKVRLLGTYTVRRGDSLTSICWKYSQAWVTPTSVARINGLSNPNHLVIGQVIRIGG